MRYLTTQELSDQIDAAIAIGRGATVTVPAAQMGQAIDATVAKAADWNCETYGRESYSSREAVVWAGGDYSPAWTVFLRAR